MVCDFCNGNVIPKKTVLLNGRNVTCAKVQNLADNFPKNLCPHAFKPYTVDYRCDDGYSLNGKASGEVIFAVHGQANGTTSVWAVPGC